MRHPTWFALAVGSMLLASCGKSPSVTEADDLEIDERIVRMHSEQERTERARREERSKPAVTQRERFKPAPPIIVEGASPLPYHNSLPPTANTNFPTPSHDVLSRSANSGN
jgi:hypothetical protein